MFRAARAASAVPVAAAPSRAAGSARSRDSHHPRPPRSSSVIAFRSRCGVTRSLDGAWRRPFTMLELAALQSLLDPEDRGAARARRALRRGLARARRQRRSLNGAGVSTEQLGQAGDQVARDLKRALKRRKAQQTESRGLPRRGRAAARVRPAASRCACPCPGRPGRGCREG